MNSRRLMSNNSTPLSGRGLLHCAISTSPLSQMGLVSRVTPVHTANATVREMEEGPSGSAIRC